MLFTPDLFTYQNDGKLKRIRSSRSVGQRTCVIPRSLCSFRRIEILGSGRNALKATLFRVQQEAASKESRFHIVRDKDSREAGVWEYPVFDTHHGRYIPESLLFSKLSKGMRLVETMSGFEGQIWERKTLIASRWWPDLPSISDWQSFIFNIQSETVYSIDKLPVTELATYNSRIPLFEFDWAQLLAPGRIAMLLLSIFTIFASFEGAKYIKRSILLNSVNEDLLQKRSTTGETREIRRVSILNADFIQKYNALGDQAAPFVALAQISGALNGKGFLLKNLSMQVDDIEIQLQTTGSIDIPPLVTALETTPSIEKVSISFDGRNVLTVKAKLLVHVPSKIGN